MSGLVGSDDEDETPAEVEKKAERARLESEREAEFDEYMAKDVDITGMLETSVSGLTRVLGRALPPVCASPSTHEPGTAATDGVCGCGGDGCLEMCPSELHPCNIASASSEVAAGHHWTTVTRDVGSTTTRSSNLKKTATATTVKIISMYLDARMQPQKRR